MFNKEQQKVYQRRYYEKNKVAYLKRAKAQRLASATYVKEHKKRYSCMDCLEIYPYVAMDYDHVIGEKRFNISFR